MLPQGRLNKQTTIPASPSQKFARQGSQGKYSFMNNTGRKGTQLSSPHDKMNPHNLHQKLIEDNIDYKNNQMLLHSAKQDEKVLKQTDKTFVLCIDPETRLPFMINMGLKTADVCDLDNRPEYIKQNEKELMRRKNS